MNLLGDYLASSLPSQRIAGAAVALEQLLSHQRSVLRCHMVDTFYG
jgi:hypothetical protein